MKKIKKSFKKLKIYIALILFIFSSSTQIHAMKRTRRNLRIIRPEQQQSTKKPLKSSRLLIFRAPESEYVTPTPPAPEEFDPLEVFSILTFHNYHNGCRTLRIDPKHDFKPGQQLELSFLKSYLEKYKQEICGRFGITNPPNIFQIFDIICVDNRIQTTPHQILDPFDWIILRHDLNATVYINKDHLEKRRRENPNALNDIIFFALY